MFQAILFDLDGTIIDTEKNAAETLSRCFASWGVGIDGDDARYVTGRTWETAMDYLVSKYSLPVSRDVALKTALHEYRKSIEESLSVVPGSVAAIHALSASFPLALVSGSQRSDIQWALTKLGVLSCFRFVLGAEDYPRSKPAPDGYLRALELLKTPASATLIFEDSEAGIASALAAGATVVAVTCTNHFNQDVSPAHHIIPNLTGVDAAWVKKLAPRR